MSEGKSKNPENPSEKPPFLGTSSNRRIFPVVGIGASAGGLEALEEFFKYLPEDSGMAYVVIQHLSPDFKSFMSEILQRCTDMAVHPAEQGMFIEPNSIYVLPPKKNLRIINHCIRLDDIQKTNIPNRPIDLFFQSLAKDAGERAASVVLSGTGSDGAMGVRAVHEAGGIVLVQSPESAKFDGMPRSALATNSVDALGRPRELAAQLLNIIGNGDEGKTDANGDELYVTSDLRKLFAVIEDKYDVDFSLYKKPTIQRRITKRLEHYKIKDVAEYLALLDKDPSEINTLYYDMLIGVTQFFRDKEAFASLENNVIPKIFKNVKDREDIRAWVPACASGEEVYSIAILLHEFARINNRKVNIKLFGTDIDDGVLATATEGVFSEDLLRNIRQPLRDRYFSKTEEGYAIVPLIRKSIVFARHNILKDPPFTKMDLVTCRNLLIYFDRDAQRDSLSYLYFALKKDGFLFMGPSESLGKFEQGFEAIDTKWKIYQRTSAQHLPKNFSRVFSGREPRGSNALFPVNKQRAQISSPAASFQAAELRHAYNSLLNDYVPPSLLVNENLDLLHIFGDAGKYLTNKPGPVETNLKYLLTEKLALTITVALQRAKKEKTKVSHKGFVDATHDGEMNIFVQATKNSEKSVSPYFLVSFQDQEFKKAAEDAELDIRDFDEKKDTYEKIKLLENELQNTRENLQATIEELETTNEELQSTNEELLAANEELQSTNEELHSVNEELYTVNTEYQNKIDELTQMTNDEENFLKSTNIGTIFLGPNFRVRKFTPAIAEAFNLLPQDIDRPISHITHSLNINLIHLIEDVSKSKTVQEFETRSNDGQWYIGQVLPYKTMSGEYDGIVLTFTNSSKVKRIEAEKNEKEQFLKSLLDEISDGWCDWEIDSDQNSSSYFMSPKLKKSLGYNDFDIANTEESWKALLTPDSQGRLDVVLEKSQKAHKSFDLPLECNHKEGNKVKFRMRGKILARDKGSRAICMLNRVES